MFNHVEMLAEPVLVYRRGGTLDQALARIEAIAPDPEAGRAHRDPVHPGIESVADDPHVLRASCSASCSPPVFSYSS